MKITVLRPFDDQLIIDIDDPEPVTPKPVLDQLLTCVELVVNYRSTPAETLAPLLQSLADAWAEWERSK